MVLPAGVTGGEVKSRAVARRSHPTAGSGGDCGGPVAPASVCLMKMPKGIVIHSFMGCAAVLGTGAQQ